MFKPCSQHSLLCPLCVVLREATALSIHASAKAPAESVKPSAPLEPSYLRNNIKCNFEEAISLYGHVCSLTKGGLHFTPGAVFGLWRLL